MHAHIMSCVNASSSAAHHAFPWLSLLLASASCSLFALQSFFILKRIRLSWTHYRTVTDVQTEQSQGISIKTREESKEWVRFWNYSYVNDDTETSLQWSCELTALHCKGIKSSRPMLGIRKGKNVVLLVCTDCSLRRCRLFKYCSANVRMWHSL